MALVSPNGEQYDSLLRQLRDRMEEGSGETIYVVGMGSGKNDKLQRFIIVTSVFTFFHSLVQFVTAVYLVLGRWW